MAPGATFLVYTLSLRRTAGYLTVGINVTEYSVTLPCLPQVNPLTMQVKEYKKQKAGTAPNLPIILFSAGFAEECF